MSGLPPQLQALMPLLIMAFVSGVKVGTQQAGAQPQPQPKPAPKKKQNPKQQGHHGKSQGRHGRKGPNGGTQARRNMAGSLPHQTMDPMLMALRAYGGGGQ